MFVPTVFGSNYAKYGGRMDLPQPRLSTKAWYVGLQGFSC